jgi:hypothetical protein
MILMPLKLIDLGYTVKLRVPPLTQPPQKALTIRNMAKIYTIS